MTLMPTRKTHTRRSGGGGTHLSERARALILERIIAGDSNAQIDAALQRAGYLGAGESISPPTYTTYRHSEAARVATQRLTEEAVQCGHAALSTAIVNAVVAMKQAATMLLSDEGVAQELPNGDVGRLRLAASVMFKAMEFIWVKLGWQDVWGSLERAEREAAEQTRRSDADEATKAELLLQMKEEQARLLRIALDRLRERAAMPAAFRNATDDDDVL